MKSEIRTLAALQEEKRRIKIKLGIIEDELSDKVESGKNRLNQVKNSLKWVTLIGGVATAVIGGGVLASKETKIEKGNHQGSARPSFWDLVGQLAPLVLPALIPVIQEPLLNILSQEQPAPDSGITGSGVPIQKQEKLSERHYREEMLESF